MISLLIVYSDRTCICARTYTFQIACALAQYKAATVKCDVIQYEYLTEKIAQQYDVVLFQRLGADGEIISNTDRKKIVQLIRKFKDSKRFVYHIDDALFHHQHNLPILLMKECHSVLVPTIGMQALVANYQPETDVIAISADIESHERAQKQLFEPLHYVHVGWFSNHACGIDIVINLLPFLNATYKDKVKLHCFADSSFYNILSQKLKFDIVVTHSRVPIHAMYSMMKGMAFLINPVSCCQELAGFLRIGSKFRDQYINAKTEIKFVHAGALGIPIISSPTMSYLEAIRSGENGFLASTKEEWMDAFRKLIDDVNLRHKMGQQAKLDVIKKYSLEAIANQYESFLQKQIFQIKQTVAL